ncbi:MAG: hypothetical protein ACE37H_10710 [Phycisphaeraceae bacterium]
MNPAVAAIARSNISTALQATTPTVFIDGVPEPALQLLRYEASLPADTRHAVLAIEPSSPVSHASLAHQAVTIAVPHALSDGGSRWEVLLSGVVSGAGESRAVASDEQTLIIQDRLSALFEQPTHTLGLDPAKQPTLADALQRTGAQIGAEVVFACPLGDVESPVEPGTTGSQTLAGLIVSVLDASGLRLQQSIALERNGVRRTLCVVPERAGRRIALPWPDVQGRGAMVRSARGDNLPAPPSRWAALGGRPMIEDTFVLVPGWDPALTGQPDADYGRLTSSDFSRYGSVYRAWLLNEDGAFTGPPFDHGPAFDVGALFDAPGSIAQPLRLGDCLTRDASGLSIAPVIESSTDSGANWSAYPGLAGAMQDRVGVRLTDDTLPGAILTAAKAGTLRLRVTASLTAPDRIERQRWDGNPFAGVGPTRTVRFGDRFGWRRVMPTSIHADAIDAGQLSADVVDDRAALGEALLKTIARSPGASASATVELAGAWTAVRVGDMVADPLEPGRSIDGTPKAFDPRAARVHHLQIDFGVADHTPRTRLRLD